MSEWYVYMVGKTPAGIIQGRKNAIDKLRRSVPLTYTEVRRLDAGIMQVEPPKRLSVVGLVGGPDYTIVYTPLE